MEESFVLPLPDFLSQEQKLQFLRATELFNAYICRNTALKIDYAEDKRFENEHGWSYYPDSAFSTYKEFEDALQSLFTKNYLNTHNNFCIEHQNQLYVLDAARGAWSAEIESYKLTRKTESEIAFDVNFVFQTAVRKYRCSLPIVMVQTEDGWRFDDFTSGADDIRWMEKMGHFDPHEGL